MAGALLKLATILSLVFSILLASSSQMTLSSDIEDDDEEYVLDSPPENFRSRSRFLASVVRKGTRCNAERGNVCNGVSANKGTSLIYCCKKHCRNVLGDENNCGICGNKCRFAESLLQWKMYKYHFPTLIIVGSAKRSVLRGSDVIMEHVVFSLALFSQRVLVDACFVLKPSSEFLQLSYTKSSVCATNKESLYGWR
ncbi:hypothetical protein OIU85_002475 [Salix viminalis]|uniref:Uncharacterized protein n=1 Tax=Salix viminalis TaxID=40686 RepID=A0A9Q0VNG4_SALVM|nr:hypothetical protein OIU85_002475 [Salix viminalis]